MSIELWEITNQQKVMFLEAPDKSDVFRVWETTLEEAVQEMLAGDGLYSPDKRAYLQIAEYQLKKQIKWSPVN